MALTKTELFDKGREPGDSTKLAPFYKGDTNLYLRVANAQSLVVLSANGGIGDGVKPVPAIFDGAGTTIVYALPTAEVTRIDIKSGRTYSRTYQPSKKVGSGKNTRFEPVTLDLPDFKRLDAVVNRVDKLLTRYFGEDADFSTADAELVEPFVQRVIGNTGQVLKISKQIL